MRFVVRQGRMGVVMRMIIPALSHYALAES